MKEELHTIYNSQIHIKPEFKDQSTAMKFIKLWMLATILFCGNLTAMAQVKYCMNYSEFAANQWQQAEGVSVEPISTVKRHIVQSSDFRIASADKELEKKFNKEVYAILDGETLYINCRNFSYQGVPFGPGYAYGFRYDDNKLCIANRKIGMGELIKAGAAGSILPLPPAIIASFAINEAQLANKVCYLIDSEADAKGKTKIKFIDEKFMNEVLANNEELKSKYAAAGGKQSRQSASNTLQTLITADLIKPISSK